jgi:cleavage and polyadenylation specificity factor subunit 1
MQDVHWFKAVDGDGCRSTMNLDGIGLFAPVEDFVWANIGDLVGPLPVSSGFWYCLTAIDRSTLWPEAHPLSEITAEAVAKAFVSVWVARFGCPQQITTDQGRQFEARLFKSLAAILRSSLTRTTAWHPASNGLVERLNRRLKAALMCHAGEHWTEALPLVLL